MTRIHQITIELTTSQLLGLAGLLTSPGFNPEFIMANAHRCTVGMAAIEASTKLMHAVDKEVRAK